jgi:phosphatidylserine decarboxylase
VLHFVSDGINYICGLTLTGLVLSYFLNPWLGVPLYVVGLFCLWFFRDPDRKIPAGDVMVAPADGKVVSVKNTETDQVRISIFLNVFNVHVARAPRGGQIEDIVYQKGQFRVASLEAASAENEKSTFKLVDSAGSRLTFSLIAGLIARRIVCYKNRGDVVMTGERIGLMKFGSRVDVFAGPEWRVVVKGGERVKAGATIIAQKIKVETVP